MISVYAVVLALGVVGLLAHILGGALAENLDRPGLDPGVRFGVGAKTLVGGLVGFGMGGLSAELSPLDVSSWLALALAVAASGVSVAWVRHAVRRVGA